MIEFEISPVSMHMEKKFNVWQGAVLVEGKGVVMRLQQFPSERFSEFQDRLVDNCARVMEIIDMKRGILTISN